MIWATYAFWIFTVSLISLHSFINMNTSIVAKSPRVSDVFQVWGPQKDSVNLKTSRQPPYRLS
uniref:Uncharacterized protein n=1 Tax=Parascaris equorum TaxID=6256 RepID=A0A914R4K9_PAREQ